MTQPNQSLQDILKTLSTYTTSQYAPGLDPHVSQRSSHQGTSAEDEDDDYDPTSFDPGSFSATNTAAVHTQPSIAMAPYNYDTQKPSQLPAAPPRTTQPTFPEPRTKTQTPPTRTSSAPTASDPRSIITWSVAMTHVRPLLADEIFVSRVRKLINNQHLNERQWWEGRRALIKQQGERGYKRTQIADVLKALGGKVMNESAQAPSPEEEEAELSRYDAKIYKVMEKMVSGTMAELALLGIPFFGTREALLRADNVKGAERMGRISVGELRQLQRRMLDFLEMSCQE